jgi:hypothetical protein
MFGGIFEVAKWKLLLLVFIFIIGGIFILESLPSIINSEVLIDMPVLQAMGMFGGGLIIVSLVYFAEAFKKGDIKNAFEFGMIGVVMGFALVIAWLW